MKLTKQVYTWKTNGSLNIEFNTEYQNKVLNAIGSSWLDIRFGIIKSALTTNLYQFVATDSDLLAHDDYIKKITTQTVYLVNTKAPTSASTKRLKKAKEKLKAAKIKVRYFASQESFKKFLERKIKII